MILDIGWGVLIALVGSLAWLGQLLSAIRPKVAERIGLTEVEDAVDPAFHADIRGEAWWDLVTLWTLPAAGVSLAFGLDAWLPLGLIGGGIYVYFSGRGIATRVAMLRRKIRIGTKQNTRAALVFLIVWGVFGLGTTGLALMRMVTFQQ